MPQAQHRVHRTSLAVLHELTRWSPQSVSRVSVAFRSYFVVQKRLSPSGTQGHRLE